MYETTSLKGVRLKSADLSNLEIESTRPKAKGTRHEHGALVDTIVSWGSVQFSRSVVPDSLQPHESQHARLPCLSPTPGVHSDSCLSSQ